MVIGRKRTKGMHFSQILLRIQQSHDKCHDHKEVLLSFGMNLKSFSAEKKWRDHYVSSSKSLSSGIVVLTLTYFFDITGRKLPFIVWVSAPSFSSKFSLLFSTFSQRKNTIVHWGFSYSSCAPWWPSLGDDTR